jgi:sulfur-carrier protein
MQIKVLFFGELAEITGGNSINFSFSDKLYDLKNTVLESYPKLKNKSFQLAVNNCLVSENISIKEQDKIVFLPPFAGG